MALAAWVIGGLVLAAPRAWNPVVRAFARLGDRIGPRRAYRVALKGLNLASDRLHRMEVRDLRNSLVAVLVPGGVLTAIGFAVTPTVGAYDVGRVAWEDLPILALLGLAVLAARGGRRGPRRTCARCWRCRWSASRWRACTR